MKILFVLLLLSSNIYAESKGSWQISKDGCQKSDLNPFEIANDMPSVCNAKTDITAQKIKITTLKCKQKGLPEAVITFESNSDCVTILKIMQTHAQ